MRNVISSAVLAATLLLVTLASRTATAQAPEQAFKGQIMVSDHRFPTQAKSPSAYTAAIRKQSKLNFMEDKKAKSWTIYFAGFLKAPLDDVEYVIKLYELTGKTQAVLTTFDQYTDTRGQKTVISKMTLDQNMVGVNKELLMTMESKGKVLASTRFKIIGEGEHFSGKVNFSDDDAQGKDKDDN
jgi:hypothetical protein